MKKPQWTALEYTQVGANIATIIAVLLAVYSLRQVNRTLSDTTKALKLQTSAIELQAKTLKQGYEKMDDDRESKALDLSLKYDEVMSRSTHDPTWYSLTAIDIAAEIYQLRGKDWRTTVEDMIEAQEPYLRKEGLECSDYDSDFIAMVKKSVPDACDLAGREHSGKKPRKRR